MSGTNSPSSGGSHTSGGPNPGIGPGRPTSSFANLPPRRGQIMDRVLGLPPRSSSATASSN
ncbi:hypothetical protein CJ030_MR6G010829 [Morella rubra]|uniref:Uncharacterized protein n=1 Tax=Morella rubra TaxID=262757 RepID=A0A6A1VCQ6_9ROSI|nr:hypothetical protein CJ030_MR6G010829 [Morella rubra]